MQANILRFSRPAPATDITHQADAALQAAHALSVEMITENPVAWLAAATTCWARCAGLGRGTSRRELESLRGRMLRASAGLRAATVELGMPEGERLVAAAAAQRVECAAALLRVRLERRAA